MDASPGPLLSLLPANSHLTVLRVDRQDSVILVVASVTGNTAACPVCGLSSRHVHSRYHRTLRDLPFQGAVVRLCLRTRRFYCRSPSCSRNVFAERPAQVAAYGRQTDRLLEVLQLIGYAMGGEAGARLACRLGIESSADTLLRKLKQTVCSESHPTVRVLGVDDWAWRKGRRYGTILVDLERKQPVDLLPNRDSEAVTRWLQDHPEVKIVSRDRAGAYSEGARKGAPHALQIRIAFTSSAISPRHYIGCWSVWRVHCGCGWLKRPPANRSSHPMLKLTLARPKAKRQKTKK
jgi:transposase